MHELMMEAGKIRFNDTMFSMTTVDDAFRGVGTNMNARKDTRGHALLVADLGRVAYTGLGGEDFQAVLGD